MRKSVELQRCTRRELREFQRRQRSKVREALPYERDPSVARKIRVVLGLDRKEGQIASPAIRQQMVESLVREREEEIVEGLMFEVGEDFITALDDMMEQLPQRKGRAPGADGVYVEMLTVAPRLDREVIPSIRQACGRLCMMPALFGFELVEPIFKEGDRDDRARYRQVDLLS